MREPTAAQPSHPRQRTTPDRASYAVPFTDAQWARLLTVFPDGVCDYSQPGIGQVPIRGLWQSYD